MVRRPPLVVITIDPFKQLVLRCPKPGTSEDCLHPRNHDEPIEWPDDDQPDINHLIDLVELSELNNLDPQEDE